MKTNIRKIEFKASSMTLHLIYTFLFSSFDLEEKIKNAEDEINFKEHLNNKLGITNINDNENIKIFWVGKEADKNVDKEIEYLDPYLHLLMERIEVENKLSNLELFRYVAGTKYELSLIKISSIKYKICLLESGQGAINFSIDFKLKDHELFDVPTIVNLSNLGMRKEKFKVNKKEDINLQFSEFKLIRGKDEIFIFNMFYEIINNLQIGLNEIFSPEPDELKIKWIETDTELKLTGKLKQNGTILHFQDPFPVTELTLSDKIYAYSFLDNIQSNLLFGKKSKVILNPFKNWRKSQARINKEILTILFRSKAFKFSDESFATYFDYYNNSKLVNMCSTSLVFSHLYSRSGIIMKSENEKSCKHANYIIPAFLTTVKFLRMQWHTAVVSTQWLDKIIENMSKNNVPFKETLKMIIESRRGISRALSDPISYRLSSGSMNKVFDIGLDVFRIKDLKQIVTEKFDMIDRLYANLFEQQRLDVTDAISEKYLKKL